MGLADLFRPKHKHSDPEVRLEAIRHLSGGETETLGELALADPAKEVRRAAIERLEDPVRLVEVATRERDSGLRQLAESRARSRLAAWAKGEHEDEALAAIRRIAQLDEGERALVDIARRAPLASVRREAVESLESDRGLAEVARSGVDSELRVRAIEQIGDVDVLRALAVDEQRKEVGFAVIDRLEDPDVLAHVANKGKNRLVRGRASRKLGSQRPSSERSAEEKRVHAERSQLCRRAEALARTDGWEGAPEEMAEIRRQWEALRDGAPDGDELAARFERACKRFDERFEREGKAVLEAAERARREDPRATAGGDGARDAAAESARSGGGEDEGAESAPSAAAAAESSGASAEGDVPGSADGERAGAGPRGGESSAGEDASGAAEAAGGEGAARAGAEGAARRAEEARERVDTLRGIVEELEGHTETDSIKAGDRALQRAKSRYKNLGPLSSSAEGTALAERYEEARRKVLIRLRELREAEEWKRWAGLAKKEELIRRAEELSGAEGDPEADLLPALKELQAEWKRAGPVPVEKNDVLWSQFKASCDQTYERVKAARAERSAVEKENLRKKEELVRRAQELAESTEWEKTAEAIKGLQREWKEIGPVPKKRAGSLWKEFRAACDRFFERRKPHLEKRLAELNKNLEAKEEICAQIEALAESAEDGDAGDRELSRLRSEFRKIGQVPKKEADRVGARYRAACERVKARKEEARAARARELREALEAAAARVEARLAGGDPPEGDPAPGGPADDVAALRAALRELERVGSQGAEEVRDRVDDLTRRALESSPEAFRGTDFDPEATLVKMRQLCERAEELAPDEPDAPQADASPEEVAAALKAALAERALGVHHQSERSVGDIVADLRAQWRRLCPAPGDEARELDSRFRAACERAERAADGASSSAGESRAEPG